MALADMSDTEKREQRSYLIRVVIEVLGRPADHVEKMRDELLEQIKEDKDLQIVESYIAEAKEEDEGLYSSFLELEMWCASLMKLMQFTVVYLPSHTEVLEPDRAVFDTNELNLIVGDLTRHLHTVNKVYQETQVENKALKSVMGKMLMNSILITLHRKAMKLDELEKFIGVSAQTIEPALEQLVKEKRIVSEDGTYKLAT